MNKSKLTTYYLLYFTVLVLSCHYKGNEKNIVKEESEYLHLVERKIEKLIKDNLNIALDNQIVFFGIDSLNVLEFKTIADSCRIFFYFSSQSCPPCIQQIVHYIKDVWPDFENNEMIVFISPDLDSRYKQNYYGKEILTLSNGQLGIPLEKEHVPFLFVLNHELVVEKLHIVNKNEFIKTLEFIKGINKN